MLPLPVDSPDIRLLGSHHPEAIHLAAMRPACLCRLTAHLTLSPNDGECTCAFISS